MYEYAVNVALSRCTDAQIACCAASPSTSSTAKRRDTGASKSWWNDALQCASRGHITASGRLLAAATAIALASARSRLPRPYCRWTMR